MAILDREARPDFWARPGTFGIVGGFEGEGKLSWLLLEQCQADGIDAIPINPEVDEALDVKAVARPNDIHSLAGIVCVRLDPYATAAVEDAARLDVPVWLSLRTDSPEARAAAKNAGADLIAGACPMMYLDSGSYHAFHRLLSKIFAKY